MCWFTPMAFCAPPIASVKVLAELHGVLTREGGVSQREAESHVRRLIDACNIREMTASIFSAAMTLSTDRQLWIFDAMTMAGTDRLQSVRRRARRADRTSHQVMAGIAPSGGR